MKLSAQCVHFMDGNIIAREGDQSMQEQLLAKINDRSAIIGIIGLGYVGLPLAMEFAKVGFRVIGYDVSQRVVDLLMAGDSHIQDVPAAEIEHMVKTGMFTATAVEARLKECDCDLDCRAHAAFEDA